VHRDDPNERLVLIRPAALPGTELMAGYDCSQPFHYFHQRYAFVACASVASGVRYRGREDHLVDRCVMVLEPGEIHYNTYVAKPANFKVFFIDPQAFADCARQLGRPEGFHFPPAPTTSDPRLFPALQRLCASIEDGHDALEQQSLFAACVMAFGRHLEHQPRTLEVTNGRFAVERAKTHLQDRFDEAVSLHELAAVSQLSQFHLVHAFTKHVGLPPHAFQVHVRVERARALLQEGMSPANAAARVGFADQSHFTRHFKRIMRVTPAEYARPWRSHSHRMPEVGVV
jgi:AraC-like DNA-binding protein